MINDEAKCPHCGDGFWVDNVQPDGPPPMYPEEKFVCEEGHEFFSDTPGDVSFCTFCGRRMEPGTFESTLFAWQEEQLERMGL